MSPGGISSSSCSSGMPAPRRLIEGGVGAGGNLAAFVGLGYRRHGMDTLPEAIEMCNGEGWSGHSARPRAALAT